MTSQHKQEYIAAGQEKVNKINKQFQRGLITDLERHNSVCAVWNEVRSQVEAELKEIAATNPTNPIFIMMSSGARGSLNQFTQMAGMR